MHSQTIRLKTSTEDQSDKKTSINVRQRRVTSTSPKEQIKIINRIKKIIKEILQGATNRKQWTAHLRQRIHLIKNE